ncbi:putative AC9 transposase [Bienertia sinuspersici]
MNNNYDVAYCVNKCKIILERLCEDYGAVIQPEPVGSSTEDFHIIQWWKNHSSNFPVLARIAKDILAIPSSTISPESAFSAGRRVLDEKKISSCFLKH